MEGRGTPSAVWILAADLRFPKPKPLRREFIELIRKRWRQNARYVRKVEMGLVRSGLSWRAGLRQRGRKEWLGHSERIQIADDVEASRKKSEGMRRRQRRGRVEWPVAQRGKLSSEE